MAKLDKITIDTVKWDGLPLTEVVNNLSDLVRQRDAEQKGINFMFNREVPASSSGPVAIDPNTNLPLPAAPTEATDIGTVSIRINPPLNNMRLMDVLDAITKASDKPIRFTVEDYAISFSLREPEQTQLTSRIFRVNPNTFREGLESVNGINFGPSQVGSGGGGGGGGGGSSGGAGGGSGSGGLIVPQVSVSGAVAAIGGSPMLLRISVTESESS